MGSPQPINAPATEPSWFRKLASVGVVLAIYYAIQAATAALRLYPRLGLPQELTAYGSWIQLTDHHFWQLWLALAAIAVLSRGRVAEWGLNLRNRAESLRLVKAFVIYYGLYFVGVGVLLKILVLGPSEPGHPWTAFHVGGMLAFGFLFVGVSEEVLFRGLFQTYLSRYWAGAVKLPGVRISAAGVIGAIVFAAVHIRFTIDPLAVTHISFGQLVQALVLGLVYAWAYDRTGSLLAPILMHNLSNGLLWLGDYIVYWLA